MSDSLILDALTSTAKLIKEYEFPALVGTGGIVAAPEENLYYLLGTNNAIQNYSSVAELFLVTEKGTKVRVVPKPSEKQGTYGAAIEFEFDGDKALLTSDRSTSLACQIYTISKVALYDRDSWKVENQLRFQQAIVASQKTEFMSNPLNAIFYPLTLAENIIKEWRTVKAKQSKGDAAYSNDLSIITPEYIDSQVEKWQKVQELMAPLSEFALSEGITNPLSPEEANIEQRVHRIKAILAALDLPHSDLLEKMNTLQINKIFEDISIQLGDKSLDVPIEESADVAPIEGKPTESTHGASAKQRSSKSAKSSPKSLPAEATQSNTVEPSPLVS